MSRNILSVIAGLVTAFVIVFVIEAIGHIIFPPPPDINLKDPESMKILIHSIPAGAMVFVIIAWAFGCFAGGLVSSIVATSNFTFVAVIVGALIMISALINLIMIPHPLWMWIFGLGVNIPFAYLGSIVIRKNTINETG